MLKKLELLERDIDQNLERLFSHPVFLQAVSAMLNLQSYRKILMKRALTQVWKAAQLPNKRDQERTLHLINELHHRIAELELKLLEKEKVTAPVPLRKTVRKRPEKINTETVAIQ